MLLYLLYNIVAGQSILSHCAIRVWSLYFITIADECLRDHCTSDGVAPMSERWSVKWAV
jgi:hypothetical protein